jgi:6-phosphofructokinase 1
MIKKVAILVNGGDCSGLNAVIRAITKTAEANNIECYGFIEGYKGLAENRYIRLDNQPISSGLLYKGGSIIGSSTNTIVFHYKRTNPDGSIEYVDMSDQCVENMKNDGFDVLFTLGGDSTQKSARDLAIKGINVIGVPKTIDNDVAGTDVTFGFYTAVSVATDALDRLHSTAATHHRIMVLEVMGRFAGWIALASGIAGGADAIFIPEIPYDINKAVEKINQRRAIGKNFSVVVVAEGAAPKNGEAATYQENISGESGIKVKFDGAGDRVAKELQDLTGMTTRNTTLGYLQRGGTPSAYDRVLSTKYGAKAMELALEEKFGVLTVIKNGKLDSIPLEEVVGENKDLGAVEGGTEKSNVKTVPLTDELIKTARDVGICLGD